MNIIGKNNRTWKQDNQFINIDNIYYISKFNNNRGLGKSYIIQMAHYTVGIHPISLGIPQETLPLNTPNHTPPLLRIMCLHK